MKIRGTDFFTYYVGDFHAAMMFYRDVLGLRLDFYSDEDEWAEFDCGNVTLILKGGGEMATSGHTPRIALAVEDVAAAYAELKAKGVHVVSPPRDHGVCHHLEFLDPNGNVLILHHRADGSFGRGA